MKIRVFLLAVLVFISEGIFVEVFSGPLYKTDYILVPRFIMIFLVFLTVYGKKEMAIWYGFGLGIFYDVVYTEDADTKKLNCLIIIIRKQMITKC